MYVCLDIMAKHLDQKAEIWHVLSKNLSEHYQTRGHGNGCSFDIAIPIGSYFG